MSENQIPFSQKIRAKALIKDFSFPSFPGFIFFFFFKLLLFYK